MKTDLIRRMILLTVVCGFQSLRLFAAEAPSPDWHRTLVVVELAGGNDGLNMVIPYEDPLYYSDRPTIAVPKNQVLRLNPTLGLNPAMKPLLSSWSGGDLAFVLGAGYAEPNRSHFRSIDIWNTASNSNQYLQSGWISRLFDQDRPPASDIADSFIIGENHDGPLAGPKMRNIALNSISGFVRESRILTAVHLGSSDSGPLAYLDAVVADTRSAAFRLATLQKSLPHFSTKFPATPFGRQVELAAELLGAGATVPVIKLTLRGFDTHGGERLVQDHLLAELSGALAAFRSAMIERGLWKNVLVMTYSEFGRRVRENFSKGTDHGTAAPMLIMGGMVRGGFYGEEPSLSNLDHGDLKFTTDYRDVYQTIASRFWRMSRGKAIERALGKAYPQLDFLPQ